MSGMDERPKEMGLEEREQVISALTLLVQRQEEVVFAYLMGSFSEDLPFRDVDVAVWAEEIPQMQAWDYEADLSVKLSRELKLPVEVHLLNSAPTGFRFRATSGRLLFSRNEAFRLNFVERTWLEYWDFRPLTEQIVKDSFR